MAGHECNPCVFVRKGAQWIQGVKIDDESSGTKSTGTTSARSAAFNKFQVATTQGSFSSSSNGSSAGGSVVNTAHQVLEFAPPPALTNSL